MTSATQAIGQLEKNMDLFILTYGQFSLLDALMAVLDQTGPAHVNISTWTAAHAHLDRSQELMESADILSYRMIVDRSFKTRQPKYYNHMINIFGQECVREINTHAKFITVRNDQWDIVIRTSMNLNENPRLENLEISDHKGFADFFQAIVDDIFKEFPPGKQVSDMPQLKSIPETDIFQQVSANLMKRKNLHEANYTHEIRNKKVVGKG